MAPGGAAKNLPITTPFSGGAIRVAGGYDAVASAATFILKSNGSGGYYILTGFPNSMTTRDSRLRDFFGGYFHQDWDIEGAQSWEDVIDAYVANVPVALVEELSRDLSDWLTETQADSSCNLPPSFRCDYDPRDEGLSEREWVGRIVEQIERKRGV